MTDTEAREFIKKYYGSFAEWRRSTTEYPDDTEAWLVNREIEDELRKRSCDVDELFKRDPSLYRRYREATAVKVGRRLKN
jgi:hypothetical protein